MDKKIVYCSGPLFCPEERGCMLAIASHLEEHGYETFLPQRDGLEALVMKLVNSPLNVNIAPVRNFIDRAIFSLDVYQIVERCDYFVFNMNGRVPDEGGLVETALAFGAGKPIVVYRDDVRSAFNGMDNSMVSGLVTTKKVTRLDRIARELEAAGERMRKTGGETPRPLPLPLSMRRTVDFGKRVWQVMGRRRGRGKENSLVKEIARLCREHPVK